MSTPQTDTPGAAAFPDVHFGKTKAFSRLRGAARQSLRGPPLGRGKRSQSLAIGEFCVVSSAKARDGCDCGLQRQWNVLHRR